MLTNLFQHQWFSMCCAFSVAGPAAWNGRRGTLPGPRVITITFFSNLKTILLARIGSGVLLSRWPWGALCKSPWMSNTEYLGSFTVKLITRNLPNLKNAIQSVEIYIPKICCEMDVYFFQVEDCGFSFKACFLDWMTPDEPLCFQDWIL